MRTLLCLFLIGSLLCSCQTSEEALSNSAKPIAVSQAAAATIAGDMASRLAEKIGPASTPAIKMDNDRSDYAVALRAALKGWGYAVTTDGNVPKDRGTVELAYSIESYDGQLLARLTTPSIALGRAYRPTLDGAVAASPLTIIQRN